MKSLHLKKLAGVGEKMRTWGKSSSDSDHESRSHHDRSHHHGEDHHHHHEHSHSQPPAPHHQHHHHSSHHHHQHPNHHQQHQSPVPPAPSLTLDDEFTDEGEPAAVVLSSSAAPDETSLSPAAFPSSIERDAVWEPEALGGGGQIGSIAVEHDLSLLDDTPLLPDLPPLPRHVPAPAAAATSKRRSSVPHVFGRRSRDAERASSAMAPDQAPGLLLLDLDGTPSPSPLTSSVAATAAAGSEKGQKLEEKIKELKLRDLALRDERTRERERRKEAERQLKLAQKERYIQGLKLKSLETKLEKIGGNKTDVEKRARKESQANAVLQKEVDVLRSKLAERERSLAERDEALAKAKRQYARIKQGGSDECSLEELEELDKVLEKSRNALLERIKQKVKEEMDDKSKCLVCFDRTRAIIFVPCGHKVCCNQCSNQVKICPICRANIEIRQKVFE